MEAITAPRARLAGMSLEAPRIMGIVNVTPDSFSDGGRLSSVQAAVDHALRLADEGADIIDIGGESTRPGAGYVPVADELARVIPVIEGLRPRTRALISDRYAQGRGDAPRRGGGRRYPQRCLGADT